MFSQPVWLLLDETLDVSLDAHFFVDNTVSGYLARIDGFWPPVEVGVVFDGAVILLERAAPRSNGAIEVVDGFEMLVDERLIDKGPEAFSGLEFWAAWRLIDEPDAVWNWKIFRAMPAGIVKLQDDDAIAAGTSLTREGGEQFGKERFVDPVGKIPDRLSARGRDEAGHVEPFVAMVTERNRPLPDRRPNPAMDRLEAEPMLIRGPHLDGFVGMLGGLFGDRVGEFFYKPLPPRRLRPAGSWDAATGSTSQSP